VSHIAVVIPGLDRIAGAEQQAMLLAKGLRRRGWRVSVVALSGSGGAAADELRKAGVEFISLEMRKGLADPRDGFAFIDGFGVSGRTFCMRTCRTPRGWPVGRAWPRPCRWRSIRCTIRTPERWGGGSVTAVVAG
jgi:hypothetical protein